VAFWPWKFHEANVADVVFKSGLLVIVIMGTAYLPEEGRASSQGVFEKWLVASVCLPLIYVTTRFIRMKYKEVVKTKTVLDVRFMQEFHNILLLTSRKSNHELHNFISSLPDRDYRVMKQFNNAILAQMFHLQPSDSLREQRLIQGTSHFQVANGRSMHRRLVHLECMGHELGEAFAQRRRLHILADEVIDVIGERRARVFAKGGCSSTSSTLGAASIRTAPVTAGDIFDAIGIRDEQEMTCHEFVKAMLSVTQTLHAAELESVFKWMDLDSNGKLSAQEFVTTIRGIVGNSSLVPGKSMGIYMAFNHTDEEISRACFRVWHQHIDRIRTARQLTQRRTKQLVAQEKFGQEFDREDMAARRIQKAYSARVGSSSASCGSPRWQREVSTDESTSSSVRLCLASAGKQSNEIIPRFSESPETSAPQTWTNIVLPGGVS